MRASIKINQSDLNELNKKLNFFKDFDKKVLSSELGRTALDISRLAKRTVPVDTSALRNSIEAEIQGKTVSVLVNKDYAPYIEFGTGSMVKIDDMISLGIPPSYAMQFKGKGLREVNLPARPFLFSSARIEYNKLLNRLNNRIKKIR
jgi:phage gpG-like protein